MEQSGITLYITRQPRLPAIFQAGMADAPPHHGESIDRSL